MSDMSEQLKRSIVRIRNANQEVVGTGFLVSNRHVLTCAHVVDQAETPTREIHLDFPFLAQRPADIAWVVSRQPGHRLTKYPPDDGLDIALLRLQDGRPEEGRPASLLLPASVRDHRFCTY